MRRKVAGGGFTGTDIFAHWVRLPPSVKIESYSGKAGELTSS